MAFHIVRNNIVRMHVDAIVNSANPEPTYAYGTDLAIYTAAGETEILEERKAIGKIAPGNAAVTSAGRLNAKYIIHVVAPAWEGGNENELDILKSCYENALNMAVQLKCRSIAFPLIATGIYGFPKDRALEVAMTAIPAFLMCHTMDVFLVVFDEKAFVLSNRVFETIQNYVDENYVSGSIAAEYCPPQSGIFSDSLSEDEALRLQTRKNLANRIPERKSSSILPIEEHTAAGEKTASEASFQEKLLFYIDKSGMKSSDIYRPIEMSRQQYSRILCRKDYQPKKNTALLLALVLHLTIEETEDLISRAGYAFNPSSKQDIIVKACILNRQYDLFIIDAMLANNNLDTLIDYEGKNSG